MGFPLPWKTLELQEFGICVIGTLSFIIIIFFNILHKAFSYFIFNFLITIVVYRYWPNNKSRMYLLENTGIVI